MELKEGYKMTELGEIPEDWNTDKLSSIGTFSKGQGIRKDQSSSGNIPCIRYGELYTRHHNVVREFYSRISDKVALNSKRLLNGSILFAGSGETKEEIGKCAAFISHCEAYAGGDIVILEKHGQNPIYLGYLLNAPPIQKQKTTRGQGDAVVHISANQLGNVVIPLPTIPEQTAIATALSDMDALIARTEKLIEKKKAIKQGMMQQLLSPYDKEGNLKKGWVKTKLGDILQYEQPTKYIVNSSEYSDNYLIPVITAGKSFILGHTNEHFGLYDKVPAIIFDDFTTATQYVDFKFKVKSSAIKILTLKIIDNADLRFMFEILNRLGYQPSDHKRHWIGIFQQMQIELPEFNTQIKIGHLVNQFQLEIDLLEKKIKKLLSMKQAMMQSLLTGKIRIYKPEYEPTTKV